MQGVCRMVMELWIITPMSTVVGFKVRLQIQSCVWPSGLFIVCIIWRGWIVISLTGSTVHSVAQAYSRILGTLHFSMLPSQHTCFGPKLILIRMWQLLEVSSLVLLLGARRPFLEPLKRLPSLESRRAVSWQANPAASRTLRGIRAGAD